jgi:hypothetical protein
MLGTLYTGTLRFDANPFRQFSKNLTDIRVEMHALMHVRTLQARVG